MSDRPRAGSSSGFSAGGGGRGRDFGSNDWERLGANAGTRILTDVVRGGIREGQRENQHQRRMEQSQQRHEQQMERGGFRHQQQMETRQMTRESRGGRSYGTPDFNGGAQPGERGYNGDTRRLRVDGDRANPGDPREYRQNGQQPDNRYGPRSDAGAARDRDGYTVAQRDAALRQGMNAGAEITGNPAMKQAMKSGAQVVGGTSASQGNPDVQVTPVAPQSKIESRPLPPVREEFKTASHNPRADQNAPAQTQTATAAPAKLTEDKRDYSTFIAQKGDTIWGLAKNHYGDADPKTMQGYVNSIAAFNNMDTKSADNIKVGQEIKLPDTPRIGPNTPDVAGTMMAQNTPAAATPAQPAVSSSQWALIGPGGA